MSEVKTWRKVVRPLWMSFLVFIFWVAHDQIHKMQEPIVDDPPVDLSDVYVPPIELRDDPDEEGYKVLDIADNSQVLIEGHFNSVTNKQVMDYLIERRDEIPKGESVILHVRRGRIIRWEIPKEEAKEESL